MMLQFDAIIVGAGPAGATAAILLARAGWSVALIEKQEFPRRKVCGECIAASNLALLDALGVGAGISASAGPDLRRVALMQGRSTMIADLPPHDHPNHLWGRALGRETLDTLLVARARDMGAVVFQPWSMRSLHGTTGAYRCAIRAIGSRDEVLLHTFVAIAAHGSWERLPTIGSLHGGRRRASDLYAFKANFTDAMLTRSVLPVLSFEGGYGGMVVAGEGITTVACCIRADRLALLRRATPGASAGSVVGAMLRRECAGVATALRGAHRVGSWIASGPIRPGVHLRHDDEFLRIGNAAGEAHPIIGEGMSMAMQSAWLLCEHLIGAGAHRDGPAQLPWHRAVRDRYAADWRQHFTRRLRLAAIIAHLMMRPRLVAMLLPVLRHRAAILGNLARWAGKVHCVLDPTAIAWLASGTDPGETRPAEPQAATLQ